MKMGNKFVVRLIAWSALMLYLLCDLVFFTGPLKKQVKKIQGTPENRALADQDRGIIARVFTVPIYLSQVDYGVDEILWRSGRSRESASPKERTQLRIKVLDELVEHSILREKVALNEDNFPITEAEITASIQRFSSRFANPQQLTQTLNSFDFQGEKELKYRIAARLQQNKYVENKIAPGTSVTKEEALAWYNDHTDAIAIPERVKARHIFLSRLSNTEEKALLTLKQAKNALPSEGFSKLANTLSADARNKADGGNLGWMQRDRLPTDFAEQIFKLDRNTPSIIETKLGWHLVEVTDYQEKELPSFEDLEPEINAALETSRRKQAIAEYRRNLRAQHHDKILVHKSLLEAPWTH